jgi:hypothetical protein
LFDLGNVAVEFGKSLLFNGRIGIVALEASGTFVIKIWRMILTREEEEEE